jgi:hypothetical protein
MVRVIVWVPFESGVEYEVDVKDPRDLEEVKEALEEKDPADWYSEPDFFTSLGSNFSDYIQSVTLDDVRIKEEY